MKFPLFLSSLLAAAAVSLASDTASAPTPRRVSVLSRSTLSLEGARAVGLAAEEFARRNGATPSIAVVDDAGTLLYFVRLDGNFPAAAMVSIGKARTAATFRKSTKEFEDLVNGGRFTMTALPDFTPLQGGVPILEGGVVIGAIGVSGARSAAQDEEVAKAGAATTSP